MLSTTRNQFLCVIDRHDGSTATLSSLVNQSGSIQDIGNRDGWYLNLNQELGERVTETAVVAAGTVIFTSYAPTLTACVSGGTSYLYRLRYDNGGEAEGRDGEDPPPRVETLGEGIASHPVIDLANATVVVQSSDAAVHIEEIGVGFSRLTVKAWHETFGGQEQNQVDQ
jgi:Tfp pilus tip-associated adhesin PilY1